MIKSDPNGGYDQNELKLNKKLKDSGESCLLRISSIGMRRTSLIKWPAWLKCSDSGVVVLSFGDSAVFPTARKCRFTAN